MGGHLSLLTPESPLSYYASILREFRPFRLKTRSGVEGGEGKLSSPMNAALACNLATVSRLWTIAASWACLIVPMDME
jgi:hypothetical protein